jgi:large repetitive protein
MVKFAYFVMAAAAVALGSSAVPLCTLPGDQATPAIAFDGTNFLVAWQDARDAGIDTSSNIYACRLTPHGEVLDPDGICLSHTRLEDYLPSVGSDGSGFFVAWQLGC